MHTQIIPATEPTPENPAGTPEFRINMVPATPEEQRADALEKINQQFTYHTPTEQQTIDMAALRYAARLLAVEIVHSCPPNADRTVAIRKLRECVMMANASIVIPQ